MEVRNRSQSVIIVTTKNKRFFVKLRAILNVLAIDLLSKGEALKIYSSYYEAARKLRFFL